MKKVIGFLILLCVLSVPLIANAMENGWLSSVIMAAVTLVAVALIVFAVYLIAED